VADRIKEYVLDLIAATRDPASVGLRDLSAFIQYGASPRAGIFLLKAAKAHAFLQGRAYILPEDIKAMAHDTLRHRLIPTYQAEADGISADQMLERILSAVPAP
jgi:MoxR-like ATPase